MRNWSAGVALGGVILSSSCASANWLARCVSSDGLCEAISCATSPADVQKRCFQKCPSDSRLQSLSMSSCAANDGRTMKLETPRPTDGFRIQE